ncbi:glycosyltransferase family 4 protein [Devosia sp. ZB163]|uniref:glycosyltransferase family 4 protein n=1 Tax=Devosia sp. ZB163 TaxID=3025938 RepID=UPI002361316B|nr:glycosyltransferase family 4 protein [Devosia sp. ZB163]MDC9825773.1 glycosyltransferase family 4 protein [Devosia sp. ZB163]
MKITPQDRAIALKVLYPNFKLVQTGVSSTIFALLPALRAMGVDVSIVGVGPRHGEARNDNKAGNRPDARVVVWHARRNIEMLAGLLLRTLRPSTRVVFTSAAQRKHTRYTDFLMSKVDAVVATSGKSASFVDRESRIIPHGVNTARFSPVDSRSELKQQLGLDPGASYVGVFGAVRPSKGTDLFIDAMIANAGERPEWKALIVGNVVPAQRRYAEELQQRVAAASLSDRITFLGHVADARDYIRAVDICVAPSRNEGFGLTPLEAMSSGVPVIASSAGSYAETVVDGQSGLLFETGSSASLAQALVRLMDDDQLRMALGKSGRERVLASFSVEREAAALLDLYRGLARDSLPGLVRPRR